MEQTKTVANSDRVEVRPVMKSLQPIQNKSQIVEILNLVFKIQDTGNATAQLELHSHVGTVSVRIYFGGWTMKSQCDRELMAEVDDPVGLLAMKESLQAILEGLNA